MQEMELQQGLFTPRFDGGGIERLRFLAMQFEGMGKVKTADDKVSSTSLVTINKTQSRLIVDDSGKAVILTTRGAAQAAQTQMRV